MQLIQDGESDEPLWHSNKTSGSVKHFEFLEKLNNSHLLKKE
jgi:hypothetical protein